VIRFIDLDRCDLRYPDYGDDYGAEARGPCIIEHFAGHYESAGTREAMDQITGETFTQDAGSVQGYAGDDGNANDAVFAWPTDVAVGPEGEVYVVDSNNHCVRVVRPDHTIETFAGTCTESGFAGDGGPATEALLDKPFGVALDAAGNVYIADSYNHVIRRVKSSVEGP
jgi:DNA-binding beta-propeller fold protein YncE